MALLLIVGFVFIIMWLAVVLMFFLHTVNPLPRMPRAAVIFVAIGMAVYAFYESIMLLTALLAVTLIVSGFSGGLGYGLAHLHGTVMEKVHILLATSSIVVVSLALFGTYAIVLLARVVVVGGILVLFFSESVRHVMKGMLGDISRVVLFLMLSSASLVVPAVFPGIEGLLDGASIAGVIIGLLLSQNY